MAQLSPCRLAAAVVAAAVLMSIPAAAQPRPLDALARAEQAPRAVGAPPTLGLTFNDPAQAPGKTLVASVTVTNPGGGPLVDFYFVIVLPDGTTAVSTGPGVGARIGTLANLRTLVPVARTISLAGAFPFQDPAFFTYTFTGAEPQGTYTVYFVAFAAGALNDGVIGGGDVVAFTSKTFTVGPSGAPQTDTSRTVAATIAPTGGAVQTSTASGIGLRLTVPAGGLNTATPITIAPLTAFNDLPDGPLVAGVRAEPSGLRFITPATLTITLPVGFQAPPFGVSGFVADSDGRNLQRVPVSLVGNVATMQVQHFSVAGLVLGLGTLPACFSSSSAEQQAACVQLIPLYDTERLRLKAQGGPFSPAFISAWTSILRTWLQSGILPRMTAARVPLPGRAFDDLRDLTDEWLDWLSVYTDVVSITDRTNAAAGKPLGAEIDNLQRQYVLALSPTIDAVNLECLADKPRVEKFVNRVWLLGRSWRDQFTFLTPLPVALRYCADIDIQAAPLPALTIGTPALMPLDIRMRFTDGTERAAGIPLSVVITATNATVSPAGGIVPTPVVTNIAVTPSATVGTITISAAVAGPTNSPLKELPLRVVTFPTGAAGGGVSFSTGGQRLTIATRLQPQASPETIVSTGGSFDLDVVTRTLVLPPTSGGSGADGYTGTGSATATRTITRTPGAVNISSSASSQLSLAIRGNGGINLFLETRIVQDACFSIRAPHDFTPTFASATLLLRDSSNRLIPVANGVSTRLAAGFYCAEITSTIDLTWNFRTLTLAGSPSGTHTYSIDIRAVP